MYGELIFNKVIFLKHISLNRHVLSTVVTVNYNVKPPSTTVT